MRRAEGHLGVLTGVAALALGACTDSGPVPAGSEIDVVVDESNVSKVESGGDIVLPILAYDPAASDMTKVERARIQLIRDCGADLGVVVNMPVLEQPTAAIAGARRYGLISIDEAMSNGYNWVGEELEEPQWEPTLAEQVAVWGVEAVDQSVGNQLNEARDPNTPRDPEREFEPLDMPAELVGADVPEGGCAAEAERVLGTLPKAGVAAVNQISSESAARAEEDDQVQEAMRAWRTCMADKGYDYSNVWEPNDTDWPEPPGEQEIATAMADVDCKQETNLVGIWMGVEAAYQEALIEQNAEVLDELRDATDSMLRTAAEVLSE